MTAEELKTYVRTMLNAAFPTVTIQFERISDDPFHIGVAVYGVESNAVKWVKGKILDIDEKLCSDTEFVITPLVRDEATTEKFYPELFSRTVLQRAVEKFLKQNKIDPEDLCRAPKLADETCRSYCPRCLAQFTTTDGECADCGGLALVTFGR